MNRLEAPASACSTSYAPSRTSLCSRYLRSHNGQLQRSAKGARTQLPEPCRITNTVQEIWEQLKQPNPLEEKVIELPRYQVPNAEQGGLENRVERTFLDGMGNNDVDVEETAYWFTMPHGGWNTERKRLQHAEEAEVEFADPHHPGDDRTKLGELREGQVLTGVVTDLWLYHGLEVDIGAEWDGMVPMEEAEWADMARLVKPGATITVRVHKLQRPGLYRFPVHLELLEPSDWVPKITSPGEWESPIDMRWAQAQGWDLDRMMQETGRSYMRASYYLQEDRSELMDEVQEAFGWEEPDSNGRDDDDVSRALAWYQQEMESAAASF